MNRSFKFPPLLVIGLTGGIASGKSTVAAMFAERGAAVLSADRVGHEIAAPGEPGLAEIVAAFGTDFLLPDGTLDRPALGRRIFASPRDREALNRITHPRIAKRLLKNIELLANNPPPSSVVVIEAALLIEAGWAGMVDLVVVVTAQPSTQVRRLMARSGLSRREAEARVRSQLPLRARLSHAQFQLDGEASLPETFQAVDTILAKMRQSQRDQPTR
jgi:dephospho-CoA kinase